MYVINIRAMKNPIMKGKAAFAISSTGISVKLLATNRLTPTGGVTKPIAKFTTIITPKCIGSTPKLRTSGNKIGVSINMAGVVSIIIPTNSNNIFITINMVIRLEAIDVIASAASCGAFR